MALVPQIAQRSKGTPRLALRLLQSCHRVCRSLGESSITADHLQKACELEHIDELGLGTNEQQYLRILAEGPNRSERLGVEVGAAESHRQPGHRGILDPGGTGDRRTTRAFGN